MFESLFTEEEAEVHTYMLSPRWVGTEAEPPALLSPPCSGSPGRGQAPLGKEPSKDSVAEALVTCQSAVGLEDGGEGILGILVSDACPFRRRGNRGQSVGVASSGSHGEAVAGLPLETKAAGPEQWALGCTRCAGGKPRSREEKSVSPDHPADVHRFLESSE